MPIIELCKASDAGARGSHSHAGYLNWSLGYDERKALEKLGPGAADCQGPTAYWTRLTHVGLCLKDYERNGYDDSDFHMIVWDPKAHEPKDICFASTRGWSYPCYGSSADATPEVRADYDLYQDGMARIYKMAERKERAKALRAELAGLRVAARTHKVPYSKLLKARRTSSQWSAIQYLLTAKIRSGFKVSLRQHVIDWFLEPTPKYHTPLSKRQVEYVPVSDKRRGHYAYG
jgi:hypothetical protein